MLKPINHQPHITAVSAPNPMHVFFDTEFTGLTSDPRLLSIGLAADNGATLYLEFTDGWQESACSAWVRQHILPTLGQGERLSRRAAGQRGSGFSIGCRRLMPRSPCLEKRRAAHPFAALRADWQ